MDRGARTSLERKKRVKVACFNCRKAKARCEEERPCRYCRKHGLEISCVGSQPANSTQVPPQISSFRVILPKHNNLPPENFLPPVSQLQNAPHTYCEDKILNHLLNDTTKQKKTPIPRPISVYLSRWKITRPGECELQSFSAGFQRLTQKPYDVLQNYFSCANLYPKEYYMRLSNLYCMVGSGVVEAVTTRFPLKRNNEIIDCYCMFQLEFDHDIPCSVVIAFNEYNGDKEIPYFEPIEVKTRLYSPLHGCMS